jgi:hypothetical protein
MEALEEFLNEKRNSDYNKLLKDSNAKDIKSIREGLSNLFTELVDAGHDNSSVGEFLSELIDTELDQLSSSYT